MKKTQAANNCSLNTLKHYNYIGEELQDINRPNLYFRDVPGIVFTIVLVTRLYIYPEKFIPKYFILDDLLRKNHFHGF